MVRVLGSRTSAVRARAKAATALHDLIVTAPAPLREQLTGLYKDRLIQACEQLPEPETLTTPTDGITIAIKSLAARCRHLDAEATRLEHHIDTITATATPQLRAVYGVGPDTAATLLAAIGDNHDRISSDAAFAKLCGVSPLKASTAKPSATASTAAVTATPTEPCTSSWLSGYADTSPPRLPRPPPRRRQNQKRDHAMPQTLHRPRNLSRRPRIRSGNHCPNIGASGIEQVSRSDTTIDWRATLTEALNAPGSLGTTYTRFYNYSFLNQIRLMMQGVAEPVATYNRWIELGRQVRKGSKAKVVLAPVLVGGDLKDGNGNIVIGSDGEPRKRQILVGSVRVQPCSATPKPTATSCRRLSCQAGTPTPRWAC